MLKLAEEKTVYGALYAGVDKTHFKHNSALLTPGASNALRRMCANEMVLLTNKATVVQITGHTDKSGKDQDNVTLSKNRAKNVALRMRDICDKTLVAQVRDRLERRNGDKKERAGGDMRPTGV